MIHEEIAIETSEQYVWGDQNEDGIDRDAIRFNLSLTPEKRFERHLQALESALAIRNAAKAAGYRIIR